MLEKSKSNKKSCLFYCSISIAVTFLLWCVFAILLTIANGSGEAVDYFHLAKTLFLWFGAYGCLCGILGLFLGFDNKIIDNMYASAALYYIPALVSGLLSGGPFDDWVRVAIVFLVVLAIVYGLLELIVK